jgi:hypothetical protein
MTQLLLWLHWMLTNQCIVLSSGYAGGGRHVLFGGNCLQAALYAASFHTATVNLATFPFPIL